MPKNTGGREQRLARRQRTQTVTSMLPPLSRSAPYVPGEAHQQSRRCRGRQHPEAGTAQPSLYGSPLAATSVTAGASPSTQGGSPLTTGRWQPPSPYVTSPSQAPYSEAVAPIFLSPPIAASTMAAVAAAQSVTANVAAGHPRHGSSALFSTAAAMASRPIPSASSASLFSPRRLGVRYSPSPRWRRVAVSMSASASPSASAHGFRPSPVLHMQSPSQRLPDFEAAANAPWPWALQQAVASHHSMGAVTPIRPAAADRFSPHVSAMRSAASAAGSQSTPLPIGMEFLPRRGVMFTPSPAAGFGTTAAAASAAASPMASSPDTVVPAAGGSNVGGARATHGALSAAAALRPMMTSSSDGEGCAAIFGRRHHAAASNSASPGTRGYTGTTSNTPGGRPRINLSRARRRQATSAAKTQRPPLPPPGQAEPHAASNWPASPLSAMSTVLAALDCTGTRGSSRAAAAARVSDQAASSILGAVGGAAVDTSPPHMNSGSGRRLLLLSDDDDDDDDCGRGNRRRFSGPSTWHDRRESGAAAARDVTAKGSSAAYSGTQGTHRQPQPQPQAMRPAALTRAVLSDDGLSRAWLEQGTTRTGAEHRLDGSKDDEDIDEDNGAVLDAESPAVPESAVPSAFADLFC